VTATLAGLDDLFVTYGDAAHNTCEGDSGGPQLMRLARGEAVVAVTSLGRPACDGDSRGTRLDPFLPEITAYVAAHDPPASANCGADGVCGVGCPAPDPDCPCAADGYCTAACTVSSVDPDCPLPPGEDGKGGCAIATGRGGNPWWFLAFTACLTVCLRVCLRVCRPRRKRR
jgi:hypothetical protein